MEIEKSKKRKVGFYWVKRDGFWTVAKWCIPDNQKPFWVAMESIDVHYDNRFDEIIEEKIKPPVLW